jgi:hypothetical protein
VPRQPSPSPRVIALVITALALLTGCSLPASAAAQPQDREARLHEREARLQEREARLHEREAARAERLSERERRRGERAQRHGSRAATPSTPSTRGCTITIQTSAARITAGESVTVFGQVTCPADAGVHPADAGAGANPGTEADAGTGAGREVTIERAGRGRGVARAFAAPDTVTTEADGSYQLPPTALEANTVFRARIGRHGAHVAVRVAPVVTLNAPAPTAQPSSLGEHGRSARRQRPTFTGTVAPAAAGARVALQVSYPADGEQWRTIAYGDVLDGRFSISHGFKIPGEAKVRVIAHPKGANSAGVSETVTYSVPQPQNPQLTIQASSNPISFGQSVTLSGVAAGPSGQTVTLLAHAKGAGFAPVATSTTDDAGNYQFTQAPQQNTYYEVSDASTRSVVLFEGVKYVLTLTPPPTTLAATQPLSISGSVTPAQAGTTVHLERRGAASVGFHAIASAVVNADGTFTVTHTFESATSATLRVRVAGDARNQGCASAPFTVAVTTAPAAALAPEAPAPEPSLG